MAEGGEDDKERRKGGKGQGAAVRGEESAAGHARLETTSSDTINDAHGNLVEKTAAEVLKYCLAACSAAGLDSAGTDAVLETVVRQHKSRSNTDIANKPAPASGESGQSSRPPRQIHVTITPDLRYRGCLLGLAICDAIAVARASTRPTSLAELNVILGGSHGAIDKQVQAKQVVEFEGLCGLYGIAIGGWSHATASCVATAQSIAQFESIDNHDIMMRLLRMYRTGRGTCAPGHSPGIDEASMQGLSKLERAGNPASGGAWHGCTSVEAAGSGALGFVILYQYARFTGTKVQILTQKTLLARVPPVVLFKSHDAQAAVSEAAQNTRATHDVLASVDAARYMSAVLAAVLTCSADPLATKAQVLQRRSESSIYSLFCGPRPLERQVREVADGSFMKSRCPKNAFDAAPDVLAQALWALLQACSFADGLNKLLALHATASVLHTYGALAGAVFGRAQLPAEWAALVERREDIETLAQRLLHLSEHAAVCRD